MLADSGRAAKVLDRYLLHGKIASGGMAVVHLGQVVGAQGFSRAVAIKRLHPQFATDPEFSTMLLDEARLAARIRHPNVVSTLDVVQTEEEIFLVMEYVNGDPLSSLLGEARKKGAPIPPDISSSIIAGALAGLHAAHEAKAEDGGPLQIVHRDVSPQNIMVGQDGIARVLDFGIARATVRSHATRTGQIKGKLRYMAPEQLRGETATRRVDIYAAGVVLWEVVTGLKLFAAETDAATFGRVMEGIVQPPSAVAHVPREVDEVVLRALARDPAARYATALEMAAALEAALPPASSRQVGAWVELTAGPLLAARTQRIHEMESRSGKLIPASESAHALSRGAPPREAFSTLSAVHEDKAALWLSSAPQPSSTPLPSPDGDALSASLVELTALPTSTLTMPARNPPSRARSVLQITAVIGLSALLALGAFMLQQRRSEPPISDVQRGMGKAALLAMIKVRNEAVVAPPQAAEAEPVTQPRAPTPPLSAPRAKPLPGPIKSRCNPPYYTDSTGIKRVKRECL
jgi:eukaryotic-like serine/threonine-protein kinase